MRIVETVAEMHEARRRLESRVSMMATLGGIHAGHEALIVRARELGDTLIASLFLNPTQFDDPGDLASYPHDRQRDLELLDSHGVDVVFAPTVEEMYPPGAATTVDPGPVATVLEGAHRPGHFRGVATVVVKILTVIRPHVAVWGAKDAQQNVIIRRISGELLMDVEHVIVPTVRDHDGLALSSRNARLSTAEREAAAVLYRALRAAADAWAAGETDAGVLRGHVRELVAAEPLARLEYVSVADPEALSELEAARPGAIVSLAARVGPVRLIDNVVLG